MVISNTLKKKLVKSKKERLSITVDESLLDEFRNILKEVGGEDVNLSKAVEFLIEDFVEGLKKEEKRKKKS